MSLAIPLLATRTSDDLPATEQHPMASERFRAIPSVGTTFTDLGLWNIFANPDMPTPQSKIRTILCDEDQPCSASQTDLLNRAVARSKPRGCETSDIPPRLCITGNSTHLMMCSHSIETWPTLRGLENFAMEQPNCKGLHSIPRTLAPLQHFCNHSTKTTNRTSLAMRYDPPLPEREVNSMKVSTHASSLVMTCRRCHEPICHSNPALWCIKCRCAQRQRGQARGLVQSMRTRRLKAWLRRFRDS